MVNKMSKGFMSQMTRPEEGERGLGASHRRGGTGRASYRRPPEGSHLRNFPEGKRGASATSKAPGAKRKVESMRDKGAKRAANRKLHIDDGCMGGGNVIPSTFSYGGTNYDVSDCDVNNAKRIAIEDKFHDYDSVFVYACGVKKNDGSTGGICSDSYGAFFGSMGSRLISFAHEFGHCVGIGNQDDWDDGNSDEVYCSDEDCYMSRTSGDENHYCDDCFNAMLAPDGTYGDPITGVVTNLDDERIWNKRSVTGEDG